MRHLIILLALLCASCNASLPSIKPFKMDIQQGNVVTSKMMLQLKPGMTKSQVRFIMGTPLIQDGFHPDRWDYFYQMRKGGKIIEQRRVIMDFENDALVRIRGDVIPAGTGESVADPQPVTPAKSKPSDKSLLDRLKFWKDDEETTKPQAAPEDLVTPAAGAPDASQKPAPAPVAAPQEQQPAEPETTQPVPAEPVPPTLENEAAPAEPQPAPAETDKPAVEPALMPTEPVRAPEMAPIESGEPAPAASSADAAPAAEDPAPAAETAPAPAPAAEPEPTAQPEARQPAEAPQPAPKRKPVVEPDDELPPEDDPGYFERMLEKIGF